MSAPFSMQSSTMTASTVKKWVFVHALLFLSNSSMAFATEAVKIGDILAYPESYNIHTVTLQGVARQVQALGPRAAGECGLIYDSYKFILQDDTGSLEVEVSGLCGKPSGTMVPVSEGDKVVVQVLIGVVRSDRLPPPVIGIAQTIQRQED